MDNKTSLGIFQLLEITNKFNTFITKEIKKEYSWFNEEMRKEIVETVSDIVAKKMLEVNNWKKI